MRTRCDKSRTFWNLGIFCLIVSALSGCATLGPSSISMGRGDYNEAINRTEDEQMLLSIVKGRYGEKFTLLAVNSVAANVRFRGNAGVQAGFGPNENFAGNLVPFSGGVVYEENPTVSYAPVQGEKYLRQLMSPVPLDILILFVRSETYSETYLTLMVDRINKLRNPDFLSSEPDPRFQRFISLNLELYKAGVLQWVTDATRDEGYAIWIADYAPNYSEKVREYLNLLGLRDLQSGSQDIVLPIYSSFAGTGSGVAISTRSTFDLIQILRAAVAVPQEHADAGLAISYPEVGLAGKNIRIHSSKDKPETAVVAVRYLGYWFYIDASDVDTKIYYETLHALWSVTIATAVDNTSHPVLTIPASR